MNTLFEVESEKETIDTINGFLDCHSKTNSTCSRSKCPCDTSEDISLLENTNSKGQYFQNAP